MKSKWITIGTLLGLLVSACAPAVTQTPSSTPLLEPSATPIAVTITPVESALAPGNPTAAPLDDIIRTHTIHFDTPDGATVSGELYGSGSTAVIFSVMGDCKPGWREFAQLTAAQGVAALTYQWRGCRDNGTIDNDELKKFVDDLRGAVAFMRKLGAKKIILAGASLGGVASAKIAVESHADGLIVIASPPEIPQWNFKIQSADMNVNVPKLFISAEHDDTVAIDKTRALFELAAEPKEWQTYPGVAHGTDLFETQNKEELQKRLLNFIVSIATLPQPI